MRRGRGRERRRDAVAVREPWRARARRWTLVVALELRAARGDPRDRGRAGRRATEQLERARVRPARRPALGQGGMRGAVAVAPGWTRGRGGARPGEQRRPERGIDDEGA